MNLPRDPGVTWSKAMQTAVGIAVGCVAATGIHILSTPVAADQTVETPRVAVVMAVDLAPEPDVSVVTAAPAGPAVVTKPAPVHDQVPAAIAVVDVVQPAATRAPPEKAASTKAPKAPKSDPPPPAEPTPPPPTEEPHHHHHHKPPKPPG